MMFLQYHLRVALVYLTLSVAGCFAEWLIGDINDLKREITIQQLENIKSVTPRQNPIQRFLQRNVKHQPTRTNPVLYGQRNDGNAKTIFNPAEESGATDSSYYYAVPKRVEFKVDSRNNPLEITRAKYNDEFDANRTYGFQSVQKAQNAFRFTGSQKSSGDVNLAPEPVKKEGLINGIPAANMYGSGLFGYQHISKSKLEVYPHNSHLFELNEAHSRENISLQPIMRPRYAERISTNNMSRSLTLTHNVRRSSNGNMLFDNRNFPQNGGKNQNTPRPTVLRTNKQVKKPLPRVSAGTEYTSQISSKYMNNAAVSKLFIPQISAVTVTTPSPTTSSKSYSHRIHSVMPLKTVQINSFGYNQIGRPVSESIITSQANQRSFGTGNTKTVTTYAFKGFQPIQNSNQNMRQSSQDYTGSIQLSHKKYDALTTDVSSISSPVVNGAHTYKGLLSADNSGVQTQMSVRSRRPKQSTDSDRKTVNSASRLQLAKNSLVLSESKASKGQTNMNPRVTSPFQRKTRQHNSGTGTFQTFSGQDKYKTGQSFVKGPVLNSVPNNTMQSVLGKSHLPANLSQSESGTSKSKNSDASNGSNQPYYLTSKKPYAFKGFMFLPTLQSPLQQKVMQSGQNHPIISLSNTVLYASASPYTAVSVPYDPQRHKLAQKPLTSDSYKKSTYFQVEGIEAPKEKQPNRGQSYYLDNGVQHETSRERESSIKTDAPKHHVVGDQAVAMEEHLRPTSLSSTNNLLGFKPNDRATFRQKYPKVSNGQLLTEYINSEMGTTKSVNGFQKDRAQSESTQRWTLSRLISAENTQSHDRSPSVSGERTSNQSKITTVNSLYGRFPSTHNNWSIKPSTVNSVSTGAEDAAIKNDFSVSTANVNQHTLPRFPNIYHEPSLLQSTDLMRNVQLPTRHESFNKAIHGVNPGKYNDDENDPESDFVAPIHRSVSTNKETRYPQTRSGVVQYLSGEVQQNLRTNLGLVNHTKASRNGITQSNTSEEDSRGLRPTSSVVIGRRVEIIQEGQRSEESLNYQNLYANSTSRSSIYRAAGVHGHKTSSSVNPVYQRSAIKPVGKARIRGMNVAPVLPRNERTQNFVNQTSEADIDLSAVGLSQALGPTSSVVVVKYINHFDNTTTKSSLDAFSRKTGLRNFKPVRFSDIAGSASFSNIKPRSTNSTLENEIDLGSDQNISSSALSMEGSTQLPFTVQTDNFTMISTLQNSFENVQSSITSHVPELMPAGGINFTTKSLPVLTEANTQPTVYSSELELDPLGLTTPTAEGSVPFTQGTSIPNTAMLVTVMSD